MEGVDPSRLVPLLGRHESFSPEQWIFPDLQFTCYGSLTKWIFRGPATFALCGAELGTWQLDMTNTFSTVYQRLSTTETNIELILQDGPIFTYELASPVQVKPGDIVGIELGLSCSLSEDFDNVLSLNVSGTDSSFLSYRRQSSGSTFFLQSPSITIEQDYIPLIEAVVGKQTVNVYIVSPPSLRDSQSFKPIIK